MSMREVKWYAGAPAELKAGMVIRAGADIELMGTEADGLKLPDGVMFTMADGKPIEAYGQVVEPHELEWLADNGVPPKLHEPKQGA